MVIHKIHIKNFKSVSDYTFDFDHIKGFWEISGDVGSGKTTVGEAILFALFGSVKNKNNTNFITWGEKKAIIEIWLNSKDHDIYIHRVINHIGQCPITVTIDGQPLVYTNKRDAQSILENEYYDVSRLALELLCIISFDGFQSFSNMSAQDTKQFLDQVFGFSLLSEYTEACKGELKKLQSDLLNISAEQVSIQSQIDKFNKWKENAGGGVLLTQEDIYKYFDNHKIIQEELSAYDNETERQLSDITKGIISLNQKKAEIIALGKTKAKSIELLEKGICPTCGATLDQSHLQEYIDDKKSLAIEYRDVLDSIKRIESQEKEFKKSRSQGQTDLKNKKDEAWAEYVSKVELKRQQDECSVEIDSLKKEQKKQESKKNKIIKDIHEWEDLQEFISVDVRREMLKMLVPHINNRIKSYTTLLQQPYIVEFDNSFRCSIKVIGNDRDSIPTNSLSTGQQKIVDMIIILSILSILLNSVNFSIIILDELFANLDENLRNEMCDILKNSLSADQTMFVISHAPLSPQYIDGYIKTRVISNRTQFEEVNS